MSAESAGPALPATNLGRRLLSKITFGVALAVTLGAAWMHLTFLRHAGGLWRDEVNSLGVANLPTLGDVWSHLQFDSFPILWLLGVRFLTALGLAGDQALRIDGFLVGLGIIGAVWLAARSFRHPAPVLGLALFALCPAVVCWGDSVRAYGSGVLLILVTTALLWRLVDAPSKRRTVLAAVFAVASVQCHYYNSMLLFGLGLGAAAVGLRRRSGRSVVLVLGVCAFAAATMLPYLAVFRNVGDWNMLVKTDPFTFGVFWAKLKETLAPAGTWVIWAWGAFLSLALAAGGLGLLAPKLLRLGDKQRDVSLFALVALLVGSAAYYGFLCVLGYPTQPWYYLALLAFTAVCGEAILAATFLSFPWLGSAGLALAAVAAGFSLPRALPAADLRLTNVDLVVTALRPLAVKGDLVIVNPWYCGITFDHYNHLPADWVTLPPISFHQFHRYDLLKPQMMAADQTAPMQPVLRQIQTALQAGHRVYLVGGLEFLPPNQGLPVLPPAPGSQFGWSDFPYIRVWSMQAARFIQNHALQAQQIPVPAGEAHTVNGWENLPVLAVQGWHG